MKRAAIAREQTLTRQLETAFATSAKRQREISRLRACLVDQRRSTRARHKGSGPTSDTADHSSPGAKSLETQHPVRAAGNTSPETHPTVSDSNMLVLRDGGVAAGRVDAVERSPAASSARGEVDFLRSLPQSAEQRSAATAAVQSAVPSSDSTASAAVQSPGGRSGRKYEFGESLDARLPPPP